MILATSIPECQKNKLRSSTPILSNHHWIAIHFCPYKIVSPNFWVQDLCLHTPILYLWSLQVNNLIDFPQFLDCLYSLSSLTLSVSVHCGYNFYIPAIDSTEVHPRKDKLQPLKNMEDQMSHFISLLLGLFIQAFLHISWMSIIGKLISLFESHFSHV